ncbi:MAG: hypothetical protein GX546_04770 [Acholeplasmataceae bacterium]|jgi:hypothetical protein|nr:hypothetical protein [Acholeplasmataceae bacterium]
MKINKRLFDALTREPNEVQEIDGKKLEIFFMTEEEKVRFEGEGRYTLWTSDGKDFRFLVNEDFYNYGVIKEFYTQPVNTEWIKYVDVISKYQRKFLFALMIPLMVLYVVVAILSILFLADYSLYILIGMMVVVFIVNALQTKVVRQKMDAENEITQKAIQDYLTPEVYDQVAKDQIQFREMRNREREAEYQAEQSLEDNSIEEKPELHEAEEETSEEKKEDSHV